MPKNIPLSSADLLTLQVLERELIAHNISKDYERELRARIEYLMSDTSRPTARGYALTQDAPKTGSVSRAKIRKAIENIPQPVINI